MNTKHQSPGQPGHPLVNKDVSFEETDINTLTIIKYLIALAVAVAIAFGVSVLVFRFGTKAAVDSETPPPPVWQGSQPTMPPEPRLQGVPGHTTDPQQDLRNKNAADEAENNKLDWVNKQAGIAQIPVDEAMKIIVAKGFPAASAPPQEKQEKKK